MRQIKFRAWLKNFQKMVDVVEIDFLEGCIVWIYDDYINQEQIKEVDKFEDIILMQYTGIKDKNGVEIYEGDVIKTDDNHKFKVIWDETRFIGVDSVRDGNGYICYIDSHYKDGKSRLEIIGNIYDNPELMGANND